MYHPSEAEISNRQNMNEISSGDDELLSDFTDSDQDLDNQNNYFIPLEDYDSSQITNQLQQEETKLQDIIVRESRATNQLIQEVEGVNRNILKKRNNKKCMVNPIKYLVSKQKRRYSLNGFNLDLTYITERIIAMGYPAENVESVYRNSIEDVQRFFNQTHPQHHKIYNLCSERKYSHDKFNQVAEFPFQDHQAPTFGLIYEFCIDLDNWLKLDERNVAGIHCKAGKGRTGVMICCYMLYNKQFINAYDSMRYYGMIRTKNRKGVTIPSQIRYIFYFEKALNNNWIPDRMPNNTVELVKLRILPIPNFNVLGGCCPWFRIQNGDYEFDSKKQIKLKNHKKEPYIEFMLKGIYIKGDVLLQFFNNSLIQQQNVKMFQTWFNCDFFPTSGVVMIDKFMLDSACKDKNNKKFPKDFRLEIHTIQIYNNVPNKKEQLIMIKNE